jgi:signal transduction histidine kinase
MRSDVDLVSSSTAGFRFSKTWVWRWALAGLGAVAVLAFTGAPVWLYAVGALAWGLWAALWFQRDAAIALSQFSGARLDAIAAQPGLPPPQAVWQEWVCGWYWQTDAMHRLVFFKPGAQMPEEMRVDGALLANHVASHPKWLSNWPDALSEDPGFNHLAYCLAQRLPIADALSMPWPTGLRGLTLAARPGDTQGEPARRCLLRAQPRWDAQGAFAGFEGILWPEALAQGLASSAPVACVPTASQAAGSSPQQTPEDALQARQMREAEQEALRYALSHDLRAPLRVVDGFTRIVKEDYGRVLDRLGQDHLDRVLAASARMNGMIDAILAQGQLAGAPIARAEVDLSALAREVGAEMVAIAGAGALAPVALTVAEGLRVAADPALVRRVLENLIGNAIKYSAKVASPCVEVGVMPATNPAVFFVRDNGAGFDMQHADKLFGMFQRLHSAKEFPGTGVGLAGVQNIVRRHGGRIWAEAKPGEGACFYFTLMDTVMAQNLGARSD